MYKVLIAEDGLIIAFHLQKLLERNGYEVIANLTHGEEVVEITKKHNPDVIILDIMLQGAISGIEVANEIRKFSEVPIIFMSALTDYQTIKEIIPITNTVKLNKPFDEEELIEKINRLTSRQE